MAEIWTFCEETSGGPSTLGLELLAKARRLGEATVLYAGPGSPEAWETLGEHGAARVLHFDHGDRLAAAPVAAAVATLAGEHSPDLLLFGQAYTDRDVAGRLAARMGLPVLSNAVDVTLAPAGRVRARHEISGGSEIAEAELTTAGPHVVIARPKSFPAEPVGGGPPRVVGVELPAPGGSDAVVTESHARERRGPDLEEAAVIVSGGRGLGAAEHYSLVEGVAAPLSAATGATRAIVDAGWVPYAKQVGQTGKTVKTGRVHRLRHLGRHAAPGGDEGRQEHHRHQQGSRRSHLHHRRPGDRGRCPQGDAPADRGPRPGLTTGGGILRAAPTVIITR